MPTHDVSKNVSSRWIEMKWNKTILFIMLLSISILLATLLTLPRIDTAQPDPYFHVKATPIAYWIGFSLSLIIVSIFSILLLRQNINRSYKFLGILSLLLLAVFIYVIPRLMYVNKIYTDTYLFVGEVLHVLRYGHVGFGYIESPALSLFVAQFSLITGVSYITVAEFLPLILPFIFLLYLYVTTRLLVGKHAFLLACLTFVALNWLMFVFNRQNFALIIQLFTWYCALKVLLIKETPSSRYAVLALSYFALVISHPASPFMLTINTFGIIVIIWLASFIRKSRSHVLDEDYRYRRRLLIKAFPMAVIFLVVWLSWQTYIGGSMFVAFRNLFNAFNEFLGTPNPLTQVGRIVSSYTSEYYPIVTLRLFDVLFVTITGIALSLLLLLRVPKLKNIILSAWFISTISTIVYVLYARAWIDRPFIYALPAFSLLLVLFLTLPNRTHHMLARTIVKTTKVTLFAAIISFAAILPLLMYSHTPFVFPPTSYLKELDFITKYGNGSVVIFGSSSEFGYYVLLNNASVTPVGESQFFDPDLGFLMSKAYDYEAIGTNFRVYTKEGFVITQPSMTQTILEMENHLLTNPGFARVYDADSWHKMYCRQAYFNYSQVLP